MTVYETYSEAETLKLAREMAEKSNPGDIFCLDGDLGVGKTVFAHGFAEGLDIDEVISSPTFTIVQIYESGRMPLYHFDVYRIGDESEMDEIGYEDCFYGEGVTLIEWSELIEGLIPEYAKHILIEKDLTKGTEYRRISIW